jgi:hypothetical protein
LHSAQEFPFSRIGIPTSEAVCAKWMALVKDCICNPSIVSCQTDLLPASSGLIQNAFMRPSE